MEVEHITLTALDNIDYIRKALPQEDVFSQLAEEAAELAQAASKCARAMKGTNPTPVHLEDARKDVIEEFTDVANVAVNILGIKPDWFIGDYKLYRWRKRLEEEAKEHVCGPDYCEIRKEKD